jgi:hypothetical protein
MGTVHSLQVCVWSRQPSAIVMPGALGYILGSIRQPNMREKGPKFQDPCQAGKAGNQKVNSRQWGLCGNPELVTDTQVKRLTRVSPRAFRPGCAAQR